MSTTDTVIVGDYAEAVFRRGREPMAPKDFAPNWADQPSRHKVYRDVTRIPLAAQSGRHLGPLADGPPVPACPEWDMAGLSALLQLSYGVLDRRLRVNWNQDLHNRVHYPSATWGRATASGGGMYPLEIYLVTAGRDQLLPGIYHYSTAHHALDRLATGNAVGRVRAALLGHPGADAPDFLLVTVRFWKNSFKYNSFCYHVVTQDLGALLGSWELIARGLGWPWQRVLWFDDLALDDVLGLDADEESVLAVIPLPGVTANGTAERAAQLEPLAGTDFAPVRRKSVERSRTVLRFERIEQVHRAAMVREEPRPAAAGFVGRQPDPAITRTLDLPSAAGDPRLATDIVELLRDRHSSFGAFVGRPLPVADLAAVLERMAAATRYRSDVVTGITRLHVLANHVDSLPSGAYHYRADRHALHLVAGQPMDQFLQRNYFLQNYNLEQVGAVLAISASLDPMLEYYGGRGLRLINAEVGMLAQTAYLAATALGIGCGAVLGFDNIAINEVLGFAGTDQRTFLFLLLGDELSQSANVELSLL